MFGNGLEESPIMERASGGVMRPCAQSGSQMSRSSEKIGEYHIRTGKNRYNDAPGVALTDLAC